MRRGCCLSVVSSLFPDQAEPSAEDAVEILKGLRHKYEAHHRIKIPTRLAEAAVKLSVRYVTGRYLPDKAIDVIDEACSRVRLSSLTTPPDLKQLEDEIAVPLLQRRKRPSRVRL